MEEARRVSYELGISAEEPPGGSDPGAPCDGSFEREAPSLGVPDRPDPGSGRGAHETLQALLPSPFVASVDGLSSQRQPRLRTRGRAEETPLTKGANKRILLVDDELDFQAGLAELLREGGLEVTTCESFAKARRLIRSGGFEVVMTEVKLPDGDGVDLLKEARRCHPGTRLFLHSSFRPLDYEISARQLGIECFWLKFQDLKEILIRVRASF
jgi:CheY-like chemotaxis protein